MAVAYGVDEHHEELGNNIMNHIAPIDAKTQYQELAKQMALATRRRERASGCNNICKLRLQGNKRATGDAGITDDRVTQQCRMPQPQP